MGAGHAHEIHPRRGHHQSWNCRADTQAYHLPSTQSLRPCKHLDHTSCRPRDHRCHRRGLFGSPCLQPMSRGCGRVREAIFWRTGRSESGLEIMSHTFLGGSYHIHSLAVFDSKGCVQGSARGHRGSQYSICCVPV